MQRFLSDGKDFRGRDNLIFLLQHLGFVIKKIDSETVPANKIFRPKNRYPQHEFGTNKEKDGKGNIEMPEYPF